MPRARKKTATAVPVAKPDPEVVEGQVFDGPIAEAKAMLTAGTSLIDVGEVVTWLEQYVAEHPDVDGLVDRDTERFVLLNMPKWESAPAAVIETSLREHWGLPPRPVPQDTTGSLLALARTEYAGPLGQKALVQEREGNWVPRKPVPEVQVTVEQVPATEYTGLMTAEQAWAQAREEGWVDSADDEPR